MHTPYLCVQYVMAFDQLHDSHQPNIKPTHPDVMLRTLIIQCACQVTSESREERRDAQHPCKKCFSAGKISWSIIPD